MTRRGLLASLVLFATACAPTGETIPVDAGDVTGFGQTAVVLDGRRLVVAVADDADSRRQGLRGVAELGSLDGMLFTWGGDTVTTTFTMRGVPIPLDIAFFDADGVLVDSLTMPVCDGDCPSHRAAVPFAFALEGPAGAFSSLPPDARLEVASVLGG